MVHQHFMLVPVLSVAENIVLGDETMANRIFLDRREAHRRIVELAQRFGFEIDPEAKVGTLSVGQQQRVEILKALYRNARILVLDEPTAVLTPQETEEIFAVLRRLAEDGHSIIFISHKLYEVLEIADRITVIRRGRVVGERLPARDERGGPGRADGRPRGPADGRSRRVPPGRRGARGRGPARARRPRHARSCAGVDLEVRAGEILGIAGVAGNGQDELVEAIIGLRQATAGRSCLDERDITRPDPPRDMNEAGVGYVPADRHRFGLVLSFPLSDNLVLTQLPPRALRARLPAQRRGDRAARRGAHPPIRRAHAIGRPCVPGRSRAATSRRSSWRASSTATCRLLVLDQPTRGLDVGSIEFIHRQTIAKRDAGTAVLLVSAELDEVLEMSDRIAVMYRGQIVAVARRAHGRQERGRPADGHRWPGAPPMRAGGSAA